MGASQKYQPASRQAGRLLIIGFDGTEMSPRLAELLTRTQPAGVILFARNIINAPQTYRLLRDCQGCVEEPLFNCVDLEGGRVDRFRNVYGTTPSPADVFKSGRTKLYRAHGEIIGKACRLLGFNVDFAPVLDLAFAASRNVMSSRAVSANAREVVNYAREFLAGLGSAAVIGVGKHFPGLGEGNLDSHHDLPVIKKSFARLWSEDLMPYRVMKRELPIVLISHANYPAITRDRLPASLSKKWITAVLRRQIGYRGLVASDDMEMGGVLKAAPIKEAAVEFIAAGGDLCLICHQQDYVEGAFEAIVRECERVPGFRKRVAESAKRIVAFKRAHAVRLRAAPAPSPDKVERLSRRLWEFSEQIRLGQLLAAAASGGVRG
jgi:beta-N-acetylhexosaminidase